MKVPLTDTRKPASPEFTIPYSRRPPQLVSLTGVTDFHGLTVAASVGGTPRVFGYDGSRQRIVTSPDGGVSWTDGAAVIARDILAVGDNLYATTADGLAVSPDDGMTFTIETAAPALYVVDADRNGTMAGIDTTGTLWTRAPGAEWTRGDTVDGTPQAFAEVRAKGGVSGGNGSELAGGEAEFDGEAEGVDEFGVAGAWEEAPRIWSDAGSMMIFAAAVVSATR